eukprot:jgi/Mesen1/7643/ME000004S07916
MSLRDCWKPLKRVVPIVLGSALVLNFLLLRASSQLNIFIGYNVETHAPSLTLREVDKLPAGLVDNDTVGGDGELTAAWLSGLRGNQPPQSQPVSIPPLLRDAQPPGNDAPPTARLLGNSSGVADLSVAEPSVAERPGRWRETGGAFREVVLIVNFYRHQDAAQSAAPLRSLYGSEFAAIHMISDAELADLGVHATPHTKAYREMGQTWFAYGELPGIMALYPRARGFLWSNDEVVRRHWDLVWPDDISKLWLYDRRPELFTPVPFDKELGLMPPVTPRRALALWRAVPPCYRRQFQAAAPAGAAGVRDAVMRVAADVFYVPATRALQRGLAELVPIFMRHRIGADVAIPTMLYCLSTASMTKQQRQSSATPRRAALPPPEPALLLPPEQPCCAKRHDSLSPRNKGPAGAILQRTLIAGEQRPGSLSKHERVVRRDVSKLLFE